MSKKGGNAAPVAPDPYKTASADAQFNNLNTYSPSGSGVRYGYTDANGKFVRGVAPEGTQAAQKTIESPWEKAIRKALQPAAVNLTKRVIKDDITNMPKAARVKDFDKVAKQLYRAGYKRMKPTFEQENDRLMTNLQARGLPIAGEAFSEAYRTQQQSVNDALTQLTSQATAAAGAEQTRQFGLDSASRQGAIAELTAALGGQYNPPSAVPSGSGSDVDYSGLVGQKYQSDLNQYNANQQNKSSALGAVGSLGSALLMKCTVSSKAIDAGLDVGAAAWAVKNLPLHIWRYLPGHEPEGMDNSAHVGPVAEDFHRLTGLGRSDMISVIDYLGILTGALQDALWKIERLEYLARGGRVH